MACDQMTENAQRKYIGRIAPTPTGYMHLGHARTFLMAQQRAQEAAGRLFLRIEDLDQQRCKPEFVEALDSDLRWIGLDWEKDVLVQSHRSDRYQAMWRRLRDGGLVYPCDCSRKDVSQALRAPHEEGGEKIYPGTCRNKTGSFANPSAPLSRNWRFRVPDGRTIAFVDENLGAQSFVAGKDFGDFLVWRKDGFASYELSVVADDIDMEVSEVVRGEDLLRSTARQLLLYEALEAEPPAFFHCPLVRDGSGRRLAKRDKALGLRALRAANYDPKMLASASLEELARIRPAGD